MGIFLKIFILLFGIGIIPLLGLAAFMWSYVEDTIRETVDKSLQVFAGNVGEDVSRAVSNSFKAVTVFAESPELLAETLDYEDLKREMQRVKRFHPIINDISLVGVDGDILASVEYSFRGSLKDTIWFQKAFLGWRNLSDIHFTMYPPDYVLTASIPVFSSDGQVLRIVVCDLSLKYLQDIIRNSRIGATGKARIVNKNGMIVCAPERNLVMENVGQDLSGVVSASKDANVMFYDENSVFAIHSIDETDDFPLDWFLFVEQSKEEAYIAISQSRFALLITITFCLLGVVALSWSLGGWISIRLKNLLKAHQALASGDFSLVLNDKGKDEVGQLACSYEVVRKELGSTRQMLVAYSQKLETLVEERTKELEATQKKLVESAHRAGMAEVATGVLHNVGNVNSTINATIERIISGLKLLPITSLGAIVEMMQKRQDDLAVYLREDERGSKILPYMELTLKDQDEKINILLEATFSLSENMAHVNDIIRLQQSYARESLESFEMIQFESLAREALRLLDASVKRRAIKVTSKFTYNKKISANRAQMVQIILNIFKNSIESFDGYDQKYKEITISERLVKNEELGKEMVEFSVADNGTGFSPSMIVKIFRYGFTTKQKYSGTGYGLHFSANYLQSIGGSLVGHSEGAGKGAVFRVLYPLEPKMT